MEKQLNLTDVTIDNALNPRDGALDQGAVWDYSEHIADLPPMQAFDIPGEGLILVAGFHRYAAHQLAGQGQGRFIIHQGDRVAAAEFADLDNLKHGLHLTRAEKRGVIGRYLTRHPERSDVWVAKDCRTTDKTVRSVREELEAASEIPRLDKLVGQDGIERSRTVTRERVDAQAEAEKLTPPLLPPEPPLPPPDPVMGEMPAVANAEPEWLSEPQADPPPPVAKPAPPAPPPPDPAPVPPKLPPLPPPLITESRDVHISVWIKVNGSGEHEVRLMGTQGMTSLDCGAPALEGVGVEVQKIIDTVYGGTDDNAL